MRTKPIIRRYVDKTSLFIAGMILAFSLGGTGLCNADMLESKIDKMNKHLGNVEAAVDRVERSKKITTAEDMDTEIEQHVQETKDAFNYVMDLLKADNDKKGSTVGVQAAKKFEAEIRKHLKRVQTLNDRFTTIDIGVRSGRIKVDASFLQKLSPDQIKEFRESLTPKTDAEYKKAMPKLFAGEVAHQSETEWLMARHTQDFELPSGPGLLQKVLDSIIPPAEAASVVSCIALCPGSACLSCVAAAGVVGGVAIYTLNKCLNNCGSCAWYRPWGCWCKAGCWAGFLLVVA